MKTYEIDLDRAQQLIEKYINKGGEMYEVDEGSLGLGTIILYDNTNKLKQYVIEEYYLNAWSSGHKLKQYNHGLPKKYQKILEENV